MSGVVFLQCQDHTSTAGTCLNTSAGGRCRPHRPRLLVAETAKFGWLEAHACRVNAHSA